ncbi:MAG: SusE domain-containing protein [Bacteroidetes bacterium]|nr:SusE domain-containing protein [Bacteroidota bacterium]
MKRIINLSAAILLMVTALVSCKKEINNVTYLGGTSPALTATSLATVVLVKTDENKTWNTFTWTNPNYQMSTGISSQDVSYTLQFDTTGSNFTNPNIQEIVVSKDLSRAVTVKEINTALAKLGLLENVPHNLEIRVKSALTNNSAILYSNVLKCVITPYLDVAVVLPADLPTPGANNGDLFLVGSATAGGWNNPVPVPSQKFTRTSSTTYEITIALTGGQEYLFLPKNGDWGHKYAVKDKTLSGLNTGGDFLADANDNFPGPSVSGNYKIVVNFKTGKFTVTKL